MLKIRISRKSQKFIKTLPPKQTRQIKNKLLELLKEPYPADSEKLTGYTFFRVDSGEYRIIYRVEDDTMAIFLIGKRNDDAVYKQLKRLV
jgi:mRNA interferase RelE/StbE